MTQPKTIRQKMDNEDPKFAHTPKKTEGEGDLRRRLRNLNL